MLAKDVEYPKIYDHVGFVFLPGASFLLIM